VAGVPAKPKRLLVDEEIEKFHKNTEGYRQRRLVYMNQK
jgi:hypothetical protein